MRRLLCLTIMLAAVPPAHHVAAQSESVPRELVDAMLRYSGGSLGAGSQLLVGSVPDGLPKRFTVRPDARTVGSITTSGTTTVVIATSALADTVMADVTRQLRAAGWKAAPLPPAQRGFQESEASIPHTFCAGDTVVTVRAFGRLTGGTSLIATHAPGNPRACDPPTVTPTRPPPELPTLRNPGGTDQTGSCYSREPTVVSMGGGTSTSLRTSLAPDSILAHYARQLRAGGWTQLPPQSYTSTWAQPDSSGVVVEATLTVSPNRQTPGCYVVNLGVRSVQSPR